MAKSRKDKRRRVIPNYAMETMPALQPIPRSRDLTLTQDRRIYHPLGSQRPLATLTQSRPKIVASKKQIHRIKFGDPQRLLICIRRNIRTQVLHAYKKTGKGGQRRPRRNQHSQISCKG